MTTRNNSEKKPIKNQESYSSEAEFMFEVKDPNLFENFDEDSTDEDSSNFRDKYKELKQKTKEQFSRDTQEVIEAEDTELDEIIKKLKSREIGKEKDLELQKLKNINKGSRGVLR